MQPLRTLDCVVTPDGCELVLYQRGETFLIQIDGQDLMGSRAHGSEEELARLTLAALTERPAARVLVGGLGMGFTLRAALDAIDNRPGATIVVAEVFPAVVKWNGGPLAHLADRPLEDRRARVDKRDVADVLATTAEPFDAILLDVDNGPDALTLETNEQLYDRRGLGRLHKALSPGGVLGVWSASEDNRFADRLHRAGFRAETHRVRARASGKGGRHVIFLGRRV